MSGLAMRDPFVGAPMDILTEYGEISITDKSILNVLKDMSEGEFTSYFERLGSLLGEEFDSRGEVSGENPQACYLALTE